MYRIYFSDKHNHGIFCHYCSLKTYILPKDMLAPWDFLVSHLIALIYAVRYFSISRWWHPHYRAGK